MTFRSDFKQRRTWDPDTGWELRAINYGPESDRFKLIHHEIPPIEFWVKTVTIDELSNTSDHGRKLYKKRIEVHVLRSDEVSEGEKRLIHDALYFFGRAYSGPTGPIEIEFK